MTDMKVLISGSRDWRDDLLWVIEAELRLLPPNSLILHGACRGVDTMADYLCNNVLHIPVEPFPADWGRYRLAAGIIRNNVMLDEKPDLILCFHNDIDKSRGTRHVFLEGPKRDIETYLINNNGQKIQCVETSKQLYLNLKETQS